MLKLQTYELRLAAMQQWGGEEKKQHVREGRARELRVYFSANKQKFLDLDAPTRKAIAAFMGRYLPEREIRIFHDDFADEFKDVKSGSVRDLLLRGEQSYARIEGDEFQEVRQFAAACGYSVSETTYRHEIFGNDTITLYPQERTFIPGKQKTKAEEVHRPVLELERVGGKWYGRCYPALFAKAPPTTGRKDITANAEGKITLTNVILMNLGNPFKALLWVEDYLKNKGARSRSQSRAPFVAHPSRRRALGRRRGGCAPPGPRPRLRSVRPVRDARLDLRRQAPPAAEFARVVLRGILTRRAPLSLARGSCRCRCCSTS